MELNMSLFNNKVLQLTILIAVLTLSSKVSLASSWFSYNETQNTISAEAENIPPSALFEKLSLSTGVEILYEKTLSNPIDVYFENESVDQLIRFIEKNFSVMTSYGKDRLGNEHLISMTILPKGWLTSSSLIAAVNPVSEGVKHKSSLTPKQAQVVYSYRMARADEKYREKLEENVQNRLNKKKFKDEQASIRKAEKDLEKQESLEELTKLKELDPSLYQRKLKIYQRRFPELASFDEKN